MHTNETLAPDSSRQIEPALETKAGAPVRRPGVAAPAVHTRAAANPLGTIAREVDRQGRQIAGIGRMISAAEARARIADRKRAVTELRATANQRDALARKGRSDPLITQKLNRINGDLDRMERLERENANLRATNQRNATILARPRLTRGAAPGRGTGHSAKSAAFAAYRKATLAYLKTGQETFGGVSLRELQKRALNTEVNPDGGYLVHPEYDTGPIEKLMLNASVMRQVATVRQISGASFKTPFDKRGTSASWVGEREARAETDTPDIVELEFPAMELYARPKATQTMLEDAYFDVEAWLAESVTDAFAESEETAYTSGTGIKKPKGFLAYDTVANASWAWDKIGYITSGANGAFATAGAAVNQGDKLWELIYAMKAGYRQNAKWMMNSATVGVCRTLKDGEGRWIWADARDGNPSQLCGFETVINEQMPALATNSLSIAFADWAKAYIIVDRVGVNVLRDPYSAKPYVEFYTRKRVGGGVKNFEAIKLLKFAA